MTSRDLELSERIQGILIGFGLGAIIAFIIVLFTGCGAHRHKYPDAWHHKPTRAPLMPKDRGCGQDITFENGETWNYPCWPWKAEPKWMSGCVPDCGKYFWNPETKMCENVAMKKAQEATRASKVIGERR